MGITTITLHTKFQVGSVDPRIFGGFLEHLGRAVYEGVYDPDSSHADQDGFRTDVMSALRRLGMTAMRYPGGNFASGYHWLDGIGPLEQRPVVRDLAWQSLEPNRFGTDEFIKLCRKMGWTPMLTVNLGMGTPEEARNWVEYCNCPTGSLYADMRAANGCSEPHSVKLWCLGNEMDGPWQLGHVPAEQYAMRAQQAAKMMKDTDSSIELVVCGSSSVGIETYMDWDRQVLEYVGELADYVSLHRYVGNRAEDTLDFYPFEMFSRRREGISLRPVVTGPVYEGRTNGRVHIVDASAILAADKIHLFAVNRSLDEPARIQAKVADRDIAALHSGELLTGPGAKAANSFEQPNLIKSRTFEEAKIAAGRAEVELPPLSVAAMTFRLG